jgi:hypothetical protein
VFRTVRGSHARDTNRRILFDEDRYAAASVSWVLLRREHRSPAAHPQQSCAMIKMEQTVSASIETSDVSIRQRIHHLADRTENPEPGTSEP